MIFDENAQLSSSCDSKSSSHYNIWAMRQRKESDIENRYYYREKLCTSHSTPIANSNTYYLQQEEEEQSYSFKEKNQFLKEISQVRQDIGLTATQEVNVNLQVLLEKAVNSQRESDVYATRAMRHIHINLATVVYETGQLRGRLTSIADYQKQHQGNVSDMAERMREYTNMLEQAQGTIQSLQEPSNRIRLLLSPEPEDVMNSLDIKSSSNDIKDLYRHRIIRKRASNPEVTTFSAPVVLNRKKQAWLPQKGLRILLNDYDDHVVQNTLFQ
ncbi:hypothetical protein BD408DRAFT_419472 [Parasitella parasitica]|nr:hypothetical protein BD408DRAFT_419472 [Parasitella parasitica]